MGALIQAFQGRELRLASVVSLPLAASQSVFQGGIACADITTGTVKKGAAANANLLRIGEFNETFDNSAGTGTVQVNVLLDHEVVCRWYDNDTGANKVAASDLFSDVYILDDHTVTTSSSGNSKAGRCWAVDSVKGVAVESYTL